MDGRDGMLQILWYTGMGLARSYQTMFLFKACFIILMRTRHAVDIYDSVQNIEEDKLSVI